MSNFGSTQRLSISSGNVSNLQPTVAITTEQTKGTDAPKTFTAKSDVETRAAQKKLLTSIKERPLKEQKITAKNLISERGMKFALGKASGYAGLKDKMMRCAHKVVHHESAGEGTGSLHKSTFRLAEKYHQLVKNGGSEAERLSTLRELRGKVEGMHDKTVGDGAIGWKKKNEAREANLKDMINFIDHEIASHPTEHLAKAKEMLTKDYGQLKSTSASLGTKLEFMEAVEDHLLAAEQGLGSTDEIKKLLKDTREEIAHLKEHQPFRSELENFVAKKDQNLKHVPVTRQVDPVADMRAHFKHEEFMGEKRQDDMANLRHWRVGLDIRTFDRSSLNHVTTKERTGLEHAKSEFGKNSALDDLTALAGGTKLTDKASIIKDPALGQLGAELTTHPKFATIGTKIAASLTSDSGVKQGVAKELGDIINSALTKKSDDIQTGFATSDGAAFKKELLAQIKADLGGNASTLFETNGDPKPGVMEFLDTAYSHAVSNLKNAFIDDSTVKLGDVTYKKVKDLGQGGYGAVALYEGVKKDGTKEQIAIKVPFPVKNTGTPEEIAKAKKEVFDSYANEARVLRNASNGNPENVIGFRGAIQTPDGRVLIAMDKAPHGDMYVLNKNIKAAVDSGKISPQAANLVRATLLRDMLRSLQHLQENGITHIDLKSPNFFVGEGGLLKMADFGTGAVGLERTFGESPVDNPIYLAPEIVIEKNKQSAEVTKVSTALKKAEARRKEEFEKAKGELTQSEVAALRTELLELMDTRPQMVDRFRATLPIEFDYTADIWSIGVTAYELFFGEAPFRDPSGFMSKVEDQLEAFAKDPNSTISLLGKDKNGNDQGTGVGALDRILNQMLHPVPGMRPTADSLLSHSLFDQPGIGDKAVRDLIVLLTDETATDQQLKDASGKLGV